MVSEADIMPIDAAKTDKVMQMTDKDLLLALGFSYKTASALVYMGMHKLEKQFADQTEWNIGKKLTGSEKAKLGALAELIRRGRNHHGQTITGPRIAAQHLMDIRDETREIFKVLYLDSRRRLMSGRIISIGTCNTTLVHPVEVFRPAIEMGAFSIICAHNHPSGGVEPSQMDKDLNMRLWEAARLMGIELDDNLIVGRGSEEVYSMKSAGLIQ